MIRAAIFDIDETLYDGKTKQFVPSAVEGLKRLQSEGVLVILATGRPPLTARTICAEGVSPDYLVCSNGHLTLDGQGEIVGQHVFDAALVEDVFSYCRERGIGLLWKYPDKIYEYIHAEVFESFYDKSKDSRKNLVVGETDIHRYRQPNAGNLGCSLEELRCFNAHFNGRCVSVCIDERSSDLMLAGVNKKTGVEALLMQLGISREECIAFGDNMNDLELLEFAGTGVCMGNGSAELKARADYVTSDISEDGIWKALEYFGLLAG